MHALLPILLELFEPIIKLGPAGYPALSRLNRTLGSIYLERTCHMEIQMRCQALQICIDSFLKSVPNQWTNERALCVSIFALRSMNAILSESESIGESRFHCRAKPQFTDELFLAISKCCALETTHFKHRSLNAAAIKAFQALCVHNTGCSKFFSLGLAPILATLYVINALLPGLIPFNLGGSMEVIFRQGNKLIGLSPKQIPGIKSKTEIFNKLHLKRALELHMKRYPAPCSPKSLDDIIDHQELWDPHDQFLRDHFSESFASFFMDTLFFLQPLCPYPTAFQPLLDLVIDISISQSVSDCMEKTDLMRMRNIIWRDSDLMEEIYSLDEKDSSEAFFILTRIGIRTPLAINWSHFLDQKSNPNKLESVVAEDILEVAGKADEKWESVDLGCGDNQDDDDDDDIEQRYSFHLHKHLCTLLQDDWVESMESQRSSLGAPSSSLATIWRDMSIPLLFPRVCGVIEQASQNGSFYSVIELKGDQYATFNTKHLLQQESSTLDDPTNRLVLLESKMRMLLNCAEDTYIIYHCTRILRAAEHKLSNIQYMMTDMEQDFGRTPAQYFHGLVSEVCWACKDGYKPERKSHFTPVIGFLLPKEISEKINCYRFECPPVELEVYPQPSTPSSRSPLPTSNIWSSSILYSRNLIESAELDTHWKMHPNAFGAVAKQVDMRRKKNKVAKPHVISRLSQGLSYQQTASKTFTSNRIIHPSQVVASDKRNGCSNLFQILSDLNSANPPNRFCINDHLINVVCTQLALRPQHEQIKDSLGLEALNHCEKFILFVDDDFP